MTVRATDLAAGGQPIREVPSPNSGEIGVERGPLNLEY